jgi:hypothetical protein
LLLAHVVSNWTDRKESSVSIKIAAFMILVGVMAVLLFPLSLPFLTAKFDVLTIFHVSAGDLRLWALGALGFAAAAIIWFGLKMVGAKRHLMACNIIALAFLFLTAMGQMYYIPCIDPVKSARRASDTIKELLGQDGTVAFYRRRLDNGWNFYLDRAKIPIVTDEAILRSQPQYDVIILKQKHMNLLKAVLNMNNYPIAAIEPVGSKRFVLLKYTPN